MRRSDFEATSSPAADYADPDLARVVGAWPYLHDDEKTAVLAMVESAASRAR